MAKTPYPLLDPIMVGPVLLCLNIHFTVLPDLVLLGLVAVSLVWEYMCPLPHLPCSLVHPTPLSPSRHMLL